MSNKVLVSFVFRASCLCLSSVAEGFSAMLPTVCAFGCSTSQGLRDASS